jgi:restriction system protein
MTVPRFEEFMVPLLTVLADGREHLLAELKRSEVLATDLKVSPADRAELLPSGRQTRFANRVGWAKTYLSKAGLVDTPRRGVVLITSRGRKVLEERPYRIDVEYLRRFGEFTTFEQATKQAGAPVEVPEAAQESPEERLENAFQQLRAELDSGTRTSNETGPTRRV